MRRRRFLQGLICAPLVTWANSALAIDLADIKALKHGEFIWRPELSPRGPVVILVSLPHQIVHVFRNGLAIAASTCSSGARGHATPTGVFTILQKRKEHYSSTYNNAPMPNMQRLTWQGIALHAGHLPGYPASHGCIRLPVRFSELLFSVTQHGTPVIIADNDSPHSTALEAGLMMPQGVGDAATAAKRKAAQSGKPKVEPDEVVSSILVSGADRKAYLMIDGVLTFETAISVVDPAKPLGTELFSLIGFAPDKHFLQWTAFGLGGSPDTGVAADIWSNSVLSRIDYLDGAAISRIERTLQPGTTMVITDYSAGPATRTGPGFTVISEDFKTAGKRL
ncbi:MAG: L,D-transpeptidase [Xanthobacteraceae bacterium]